LELLQKGHADPAEDDAGKQHNIEATEDEEANQNGIMVRQMWSRAENASHDMSARQQVQENGIDRADDRGLNRDFDHDSFHPIKRSRNEENGILHNDCSVIVGFLL
jgi:hypothetical protein